MEMILYLDMLKMIRINMVSSKSISLLALIWLYTHKIRHEKYPLFQYQVLCVVPFTAVISRFTYLAYYQRIN